MIKEAGLKLSGYKVIEGIITCETGLHIGGTADKIEIGGIDNPIIRHPITNLPYIPGSSIKGKMRSLIEWKLGNFAENGDVHEWCSNNGCPVCRIFGTSADEAKIGPSRLIVRDAHLTETSERLLKKMQEDTGLAFVENKTENSINRLTAKANPRTQERVPAGTEFKFEMVYRIFDLKDNGGKTDDALYSTVEEGIKLIRMDALGGSGSRGYGKVKIEISSNHTYKITENGIEEVKDV
ncbi:MAG: type III-A CRISPR-associated RAMP protein Csm3 [Planctomycetes bacterium GWC2_39_26]|nr:MAG: type III-A CRISPR-associated RAMP protein Csm3 [Planctomycetes bacterium GWC2_39_26]